MIYLDNNATTRIDPRVLESMMPYLTSEFGNAASNHSFGVEMNQAVRVARENVAELIGSDPAEVIFTSGATEAINLAIRGTALQNKEKGRHIITVSTEHPAVLDTCKSLEDEGFNLSYLPVMSDGIVNLDELEAAIRPDTILISVMLVNNETGVIQPIKEISSIAHERDILFMTDATQAVGKIPIDVNKMGIDLMAFSGHKFYGPKGVGGLFVRSKRPFKVRLMPIIHGGGHERGMRSGTLNVPGIVGIGEAARLAKLEMKADSARIADLRDYLEMNLLAIENSRLNGHKTKRLYTTTNICFKGADADAMIIDLDNILVSNGSACSSTKVEPSHVLVAMGLSTADSYSSLRFSVGRFNTKQDVEMAVEALQEIVANLRLMN